MGKATEIKQSIIIPTGGDCLRLEWALWGLTRQENAPRREVWIVADVIEADLSPVQELAAVYRSRRYETTVIPYVKGDKGLFRAGSARNLGIAKAQGEQCVFLDGDCVPDPDFCTAHWAIRAGAAYGLRRRLPERLVLPFGQTNHEPKYLTMYSRSDPRLRLENSDCWQHWYTCNASAPTGALCEIGGFDPEFDGAWGLEDTQLANRLSRYGIEFVSLGNRGRVTHLDHEKRIPREDRGEITRRVFAEEYSISMKSQVH